MTVYLSTVYISTFSLFAMTVYISTYLRKYHILNIMIMIKVTLKVFMVLFTRKNLARY